MAPSIIHKINSIDLQKTKQTQFSEDLLATRSRLLGGINVNPWWPVEVYGKSQPLVGETEMSTGVKLIPRKARSRSQSVTVVGKGVRIKGGQDSDDPA